MGVVIDSYLIGEFKVVGKFVYLLIYIKSYLILKIEMWEKVYYYIVCEG